LLGRAERSSPKAAQRRAAGAGLDGERAHRAIIRAAAMRTTIGHSRSCGRSFLSARSPLHTHAYFEAKQLRRPLSPAFAETAGFGIRLAPLADVNQETLFRDRERDVTAQLVVGDSKNTAPWRGPRPICDEFEAYGYRRIGAELRH
jgi:hypothetical protein